jgi:hypothetical protein
MQIHDFYSKLTSVTEEGHLFQALRSLSLVEDPKSVAAEDAILSDWIAWPPVGANAASLATATV